MEKERIFSRKTQSCYLSAAKIICFSFLTFIPVGVFAESVDVPTVQVTQQAGVVKGIVVDAQGETIIGASVTIKGGTVGTITDIDGNFSLTVPTGSQLVVSFIGYIRQFVTPKVGQPLRVVLQEDTKVLDEVVVVGYGTQKAKNVTGSITQISASQVEDLPVSNLSEALAGQINGLSVNGGSGRPGENANISIRQSFSYSKDGGDSTPLVIIDDVIQVDPETGRATLEQFNQLDASEVESISVLRDASAAIYGSRASQGAIIVKTKRGKSGAPKISYSGKFGFNDAVGHPKALTGADYGLFSNSFVVGANQAKRDEPSKLYSDTELQALNGLNYDWLDEAWSSAFTMNHSLNVSGGSDRATYFAGASYYTQGANMGASDYDKWTFRSGVDVKLTSDLKFSASISAYQNEIEKSFAKGGTAINAYGGRPDETGEYKILSHMPHHIPWAVTLDDGNEYFTSPIPSTYRAAGNATTQDKISSWNYFAMLKNGSFSKTKDFGYNANFSMTYAVPFVKGLTVKGTYSSSRASSDNEQVFMPYTLAYVKSPIQAEKHLYDAWTSASDYQFKPFTGRTRVVYKDNLVESRQMNFYINYERTFGLHSLSAMGSVERTDGMYSSKQMIYEKPDPNNYLGTSASAGVMDVSNSVTGKGESGSLSYLGRINYNYADRYMLQFIFRTDASTKFAPENYWGFFPGVSAGWVASEESFFKEKLPWFEYLKVRASWGRTGKDNIKAWKWKQTYDLETAKGSQFGPNGGIYSTGLFYKTSANRKAKWDTTDKFNMGLDTRFLNGRLGFTMDFYYDMNYDILNQNVASVIGVPIFAGGAYAEENTGRVDAYGAELSINWRDKIGKVNYNVGVDFGFSGNKVKDWPNVDAGYPAANTTRAGLSTIFPVWGYNVWRETSGGDGVLRNQADIDNYWNYLTTHATNAGVSPKYLGKDKKELKPGMLAYQDLHGQLVDGKETGPDGQVVASQDYSKLCERNKTHGFTTKLGASWKGISFNAMISTSWGGLRMIDQTEIKTGSHEMVWTPDSFWSDMYDEVTNPNGRYPNLGTDRVIGGSVVAPSDFWTISTFRCYIKNLSVGYTLPKAWLAPAKIESARLSLTGNNLWDFYNPYPNKYRTMYDESTTMYPTLRTWSLGVSITF